jgi:hypothetical protein
MIRDRLRPFTLSAALSLTLVGCAPAPGEETDQTVTQDQALLAARLEQEIDQMVAKRVARYPRDQFMAAIARTPWGNQASRQALTVEQAPAARTSATASDDDVAVVRQPLEVNPGQGLNALPPPVRRILAKYNLSRLAVKRIGKKAGLDRRPERKNVDVWWGRSEQNIDLVYIRSTRPIMVDGCPNCFDGFGNPIRDFNDYIWVPANAGGAAVVLNYFTTAKWDPLMGLNVTSPEFWGTLDPQLLSKHPTAFDQLDLMNFEATLAAAEVALAVGGALNPSSIRDLLGGQLPLGNQSWLNLDLNQNRDP